MNKVYGHGLTYLALVVIAEFLYMCKEEISHTITCLTQKLVILLSIKPIIRHSNITKVGRNAS